MNSTGQCRGVSRVILRILIVIGLCESLAAAPYSGGDGTSGAPYMLSTAADLATLANTSADWGQWFILTTDLDMQSTPFATPIGTRTMPFTGVFDGAGYAIRGLMINDTTATSVPLGLFGVVGTPGLIERLRVVSPSVTTTGSASVGGLAGQTMQGVTIQQCSIEGGAISAPASDAAGGLIGDNGGTVRECYATATVTALGLAGGLLGRSEGIVENCVTAASVTTTKVGTGTAAGGLSGADVGGSVSFCFANSLSISGTRTGGLIGYADPNSIIINSVCNMVVTKAVENWPADVVGSAWCEDANNLRNPSYFAGLGWDLQTIWSMGSGGALGLRWMGGGPTAIIKGPSGTVQPDPQTGLATIVLDGTQSTGTAGETLTYTWRCLTSSGDATDIVIDSIPSPTVVLPVGSYRIELTVSDSQATSSPATLSIIVATTAGGSDDLPVAVIKGPTDRVRPDPATGSATITLDGSQSSDPRGSALKYNWRCLTSTGGVTGIVIDAVPSPTIKLPVGAYRIELVVNNGIADSSPTSVTVIINAAPTAVAKGPDGSVRPDSTGFARVVLDGTQSSDPEDDPLTYTWRCLTEAGGTTGVTINSVASPTVSLPAGTYRIVLTVNDGLGDSEPSTISVIVGGTNTPPTAVIRGPAGVVPPDPKIGYAKIALDGSQSSDPENDPLTYTWRCLTETGGATGITIDSVPSPTVSLPAGTYRIELTVNDGTADSTPVAITVAVKTTTGPTAVAKGPSGIVRPDPTTGLARITLDGTQSGDPEKDPLKYTWKCLTAGGSATGVTIDSVANPTVSLPAGSYRIELTVSDGVTTSAPSAVSFAVNTAPVAEAGGPVEVLDDGNGARQVRLDGSGSYDPDKGQGLTYTWTCATANPSQASGPTPTLVFPQGTHTVRLVVSDGVESAQDSVQVTVGSTLTAALTAVSPGTIGRNSFIDDVDFYLLLPAGTSVADVDTQAPITLDLAGNRILLQRDSRYKHKKYTVVGVTDRKQVLAAAGAANGSRSALMGVPLKTGETVYGTVRLDITDGLGMTLFQVTAERTYYYLDTKTWK